MKVRNEGDVNAYLDMMNTVGVKNRTVYISHEEDGEMLGTLIEVNAHHILIRNNDGSTKAFYYPLDIDAEWSFE